MIQRSSYQKGSIDGGRFNVWFPEALPIYDGLAYGCGLTCVRGWEKVEGGASRNWQCRGKRKGKKRA